MIFRSCLVVALAPLLALAVSDPPRSVPKSGYRDWRVYGGGPESIRYSVLDQINRGNVRKLQVAWTYDTGDVFPESEMQCNPIVIDGVLYASSPKVRVFALDAATGKQIWRFDPNEGARRVGKQRNRGLTWWQDGSDAACSSASGNGCMRSTPEPVSRSRASARTAASTCARGLGATLRKYRSASRRRESSTKIC